jgi:hypothetical protein
VTFQLPVIFQTISHQLFEDHPSLKSFTSPKGIWWDFKKVEHLALFRLCHVTHNLLKEFEQVSPNNLSKPFPTFIDEGLVKAGSEIELMRWHESFLNAKITSVRSKDSFGIQLADFAAFCISRSQWIMGKIDPGKGLNEADKHILSISGKLNLWNLDKFEVDHSTFSRKNYEFIMMKDRKEKGLNHKPSKK